MTKLEAAYNAIVLWSHIAEQNRKGRIISKCEAVTELGLPPMESDCPCCEYVAEAGKTCADCPIWPSEEYGCLAPNSPYSKWDLERIADKPAPDHAFEVVQLAVKAFLKEISNDPL